MPSTKAHRRPGRLLLKTGDLAEKRDFRPCQTTHERIRENSVWGRPSACRGLQSAFFECRRNPRERTEVLCRLKPAPQDFHTAALMLFSPRDPDAPSLSRTPARTPRYTPPRPGQVCCTAPT